MSRAQTCVAPPQGLVAWWQAENNGNAVGGYNVLLRNGASFAAGKVGQAFSFDGVDDYAVVPYNESFNFAPSGQFTIETWVRLEASDHYKALIVKGPLDGQWDWGLWCNTQNRFEAGHHNNSAAISTTVAQSGVWYHVAVTYRNGNWTTYVNGVAEAQTANNFIDQSPGALTFGRKGEQHLAYGEPGYFKGSLDEPAIYNRALSAAEIKSLFDSGSAGKCEAILKPPALLPEERIIAGDGVAAFAANKHFYELVQLGQPLPWYQAISAAERRVYRGMPGHLATITSAGEQDFVTKLCLGSEPWIGAFQAFGSVEPNEGFTWITGEPFAFANWRAGEPSDTPSALGGEDTVNMASGGAWNDVSRRATTKSYLVEYEPQAAIVVPKTPQ